MKKPLLLWTLVSCGSAALPLMATEPATEVGQADPMYKAVFGGRDRVASIRAPDGSDDQVAEAAADWPEVAVHWHPRTVPMTPDRSR